MATLFIHAFTHWLYQGMETPTVQLILSLVETPCCAFAALRKKGNYILLKAAASLLHFTFE